MEEKSKVLTTPPEGFQRESPEETAKKVYNYFCWTTEGIIYQSIIALLFAVGVYIANEFIVSHVLFAMVATAIFGIAYAADQFLKKRIKNSISWRGRYFAHIIDTINKS